jgi:hypothetical protein
MPVRRRSLYDTACHARGARVRVPSLRQAINECGPIGLFFVSTRQTPRQCSKRCRPEGSEGSEGSNRSATWVQERHAYYCRSAPSCTAHLI